MAALAPAAAVLGRLERVGLLEVRPGTDFLPEARGRQGDARHAAAIRMLNGAPVAEGGFDKALDMQEALDAGQPFVMP